MEALGDGLLLNSTCVSVFHFTSSQTEAQHCLVLDYHWQTIRKHDLVSLCGQIWACKTLLCLTPCTLSSTTYPDSEG